MGTLDNIHKSQEFDAQPNVPFVILLTEVILLMPIFRWDGTHWVDATGDYDMCLSANKKYLEFINRRGVATKYLYRYINPFWFVANRS